MCCPLVLISQLYNSNRFVTAGRRVFPVAYQRHQAAVAPVDALLPLIDWQHGAALLRQRWRHFFDSQ
jgi:hypothetical protein